MENEYCAPWQQSAERLHAVTRAGEELLKRTAHQADEGFHRAKAGFETAIADIKDSAMAMEQASLRKVKLASAKADLYVKENPWQALGYGVAAAGFIGVILGCVITRR